MSFFGNHITNLTRTEHSDWKENNSGKFSFIQNRPFFEDESGKIHKLDKDFLPDEVALKEDIRVTSVNGMTGDVVIEAGGGDSVIIPDGIYVQENEPIGAEDGALWVDLDEEIGSEQPGVGQFGLGENAEVFNGIDPANASGDYSHAEGRDTIAAGVNSHVQGAYNLKDNGNRYAHIVGNGKHGNRSNAHTLDWEGNAWFQGEVYVGGNSQDDADRLVRLSEIGGGGLGVQSDWNQNDETANDYIKNKTHYSGPRRITWDGDITGKTAVPLLGWYKISDKISINSNPTLTVTRQDGTIETITLKYAMGDSDLRVYSIGGFAGSYCPLIFTLEDNVDCLGIIYPTAGVYLSSTYAFDSIEISDGLNVSIVHNGYTEDKLFVAYASFVRVSDPISMENISMINGIKLTQIVTYMTPQVSDLIINNAIIAAFKAMFGVSPIMTTEDGNTTILAHVANIVTPNTKITELCKSGGSPDDNMIFRTNATFEETGLYLLYSVETTTTRAFISEMNWLETKQIDKKYLPNVSWNDLTNKPFQYEKVCYEWNEDIAYDFEVIEASSGTSFERLIKIDDNTPESIYFVGKTIVANLKESGTKELVLAEEHFIGNDEGYMLADFGFVVTGESLDIGASQPLTKGIWICDNFKDTMSDRPLWWKIIDPAIQLDESVIPNTIARVSELQRKTITNPETAAVGQLMVIEEVNENGAPIKWKAVDASSLMEAILPAVSAEDEGKTLTVVDGKWQLA